jgi:hypothetical protein
MFSLGFGSKAAKAATAAANNGGSSSGARRNRLYKKKRPRAAGGGPATPQPLEGLCICLSGFSAQVKEDYSKMILNLGGE